MSASTTLNAAELARELGRSESWVHENWRTEVKARRLPQPLHGGVRPLVWSRAHVYALLDAPLTPPQRLAAAAYRAAEQAALEAAGVSTEQLDAADWRAKLDKRFEKVTT